VVGQVKVLFRSDDIAESMWADDCGAGTYLLDNVPLFVYGISYRDHFIAHLEESQMVFDRVTKRSDNWTYRVTYMPDAVSRPEPTLLLAEVRRAATLASAYGPEHYSFNVPSSNRTKGLEEALATGHELLFWEWEISSSPEDPLDE
jgi:hypothetical protein